MSADYHEDLLEDILEQKWPQVVEAFKRLIDRDKFELFGKTFSDFAEEQLEERKRTAKEGNEDDSCTP